MRYGKNNLMTLFISISILFISQVAYGDSQSGTPPVQLLNASITNWIGGIL